MNYKPGVPQKINPNIPSKTKSFQRLQNEEVIEFKIRKKKFEDFGNLTITAYVKIKAQSIKINNLSPKTKLR